jgi:class 3 adenylate cyclase
MQPFDGYMAQYDSDGLLVYFGYPVAHEDAAQRAVRAGLALLEALQRLVLPVARAPGLRLAVRLSIHTGQVVEAPGDAAHGAPPVSGVMLSVAKRLHEHATPDTVLLSAETYQLVQGYVVCEALVPPRSPSGDASLVLYRVLRESRAQSRFDVAAAGGLTPLVGRNAEVALLLERWAQIQEGLGQVVVVSGESGIGSAGAQRSGGWCGAYPPGMPLFALPRQ